MTINELDQGIRNLIANNPSVVQENSEFITNLNSIIEAFRAFNYRVQNYPYQDSIKLGLLGEMSRTEDMFTRFVMQTMQTRGINLALYIPQIPQYVQMMNPYGMMNNVAPQFNPNIYSQVNSVHTQQNAFVDQNLSSQNNQLEVKKSEFLTEEPEIQIPVEKEDPAEQKELTEMEELVEKEEPIIEKIETKKSTKRSKSSTKKLKRHDYLMELMKKDLDI